MRFLPTLSASQPLQARQSLLGTLAYRPESFSAEQQRWSHRGLGLDKDTIDKAVASKDYLQEQLPNDCADGSHDLDQSIVDLRYLVSMFGEVAKPYHIRHQIDRKNLQRLSAKDHDNMNKETTCIITVCQETRSCDEDGSNMSLAERSLIDIAENQSSPKRRILMRNSQYLHFNMLVAVCSFRWSSYLYVFVLILQISKGLMPLDHVG